MPLITEYTSVDAIKLRLRQVNDNADALDEELLAVLVTSASSIVYRAIVNDLKDADFQFGTLSATRPVQGIHSQWLPLPPHGGVTAVVDASGTPVSAATYETEATGERRWSLRFKNADPWAEGALYWSGRYTVTALWGYGVVPGDIADLATDVAVDLWRKRDAGFYGEVGSADGAVQVMKVLGKQLIISNFVETLRRDARYE